MGNKAAVTVPAVWLKDDLLPDLSMVSGQPAFDRVKVRAAYTSTPVKAMAGLGFLLLGIIGVFLALRVGQKRVHGLVAVKSKRKFTNFYWASFASIVVGIGILFLPTLIGLSEDLSIGVFFLGVVSATVFGFLGSRRTGGAKIELSADMSLVTFKNVHPGYAALVLDALARPKVETADIDPGIPFVPGSPLPAEFLQASQTV